MWSRPILRAEVTQALCPARRCQSCPHVLGAGSSCVMNGTGAISLCIGWAWRHLHTQLRPHGWTPELLMWEVKQTWGTSCQTRGCHTLHEKRLRSPEKLLRWEMTRAVAMLGSRPWHGVTKHERLLSQVMMVCHHLITQLFFRGEWGSALNHGKSDREMNLAQNLGCDVSVAEKKNHVLMPARV